MQNIYIYLTSSFPPIISIDSSFTWITCDLVLFEQSSGNSLHIPLVTSNTSIEFKNLSLNPAEIKLTVNKYLIIIVNTYKIQICIHLSLSLSFHSHTSSKSLMSFALTLLLRKSCCYFESQVSTLSFEGRSLWEISN